MINPSPTCARCQAPLTKPATICDACNAILEKEFEDRNKRELLEQRLKDYKASGVLSVAFELVWNEGSDPSCEAQNAKAWNAIHTFPGFCNVYLHGPSGVGKTYGGLYMLAQRFNQFRSVGEVTAHRLVEWRRTHWEGRRFESWCRVSWLLIDDIDKADYSHGRLMTLWEVLNLREAQRKRTIITSNLTPHELEDYFRRLETNSSQTTAIMDRLKPVEVIEMKGKSLRGAKG
jgi:DNA replication protein DnaC